MSRKRIQKRVNRLFTDIKDASDDTETPLPSPEISEQHYAKSFDQPAGEDGKVSVSAPEAPARRPSGIFQRLKGLFTRGKPEVEDVQEVSPDELKVDQRLVGEQPPNIAPEQAIPRPKRGRRKRVEQPEQRSEDEKAETDEPRAPVVTKDAVEPKFEEIRPAALEGYEPPLPKKLSGWERFQEWFRQWPTELKVLLFSSIFVFAAISFFLIIALFRPAQPAVVPPVVSNLDPTIPIPAAVTLPGEQTFELSLGAVVDGEWSPQAPEWLVDTEVPRWLSLPWNEDLEAAVRLYARNDPIQLRMSNGDILVYRFQILEEISPAELPSFHAYTADLLILLHKTRASTYLVLVAAP